MFDEDILPIAPIQSFFFLQAEHRETQNILYAISTQNSWPKCSAGANWHRLVAGNANASTDTARRGVRVDLALLSHISVTLLPTCAITLASPYSFSLSTWKPLPACWMWGKGLTALQEHSVSYFLACVAENSLFHPTAYIHGETQLDAK